MLATSDTSSGGLISSTTDVVFPRGFNYPPKDEQQFLMRGSLRQTALDMLRNGGTFEQIEELCEKFPKRRNSKRSSDPEKLRMRAYSLINIINKEGGWAIKSVTEDGVRKIYALTKAQWDQHKSRIDQ